MTEHAELANGSRTKKSRSCSVEQHWRPAVERIIAALARTKKVFTSDDVLLRLAARGIAIEEPRHLGPVMQECRRLGLIEPTGVQISRRPARNRGYVTRWIGA